jgi:hypothetical protein
MYIIFCIFGISRRGLFLDPHNDKLYKRSDVLI